MPGAPDGDATFDDDFIFPMMELGDTDEGDTDGAHAGDSGNEGGDEDSITRKDLEKLPFKPVMSLRQRRRSKLGLGGGIPSMVDNMPGLNLNFKHKKMWNHHEDSGISEISEENTPMTGSPKSTSFSPKDKWWVALKKISSLEDQWAKHNIDQLETEKCIRHRYDAEEQNWVTDEVYVKMEETSFNHGAMRACYRLKGHIFAESVKKLSNFAKEGNWKKAHNYVAKRYMESVDRDVYFEDVRLQMDAKLWGEEYNRHNPPKKVDIFQMSVVEFVDRPGTPLYHLEHFIEGNYIKYNSNSGFVDENIRFTPHAFSHFTFERSGHQLIVVDIQGVGDLWTDPQIHTEDGLGYGDGNLGTRGMALFFHSHQCNTICNSLGLYKFDFAPSEQARIAKRIKCGMKNFRRGTVVTHRVEQVICASPSDKHDLTSFLLRSRSRTSSTTFSDVSETSEDEVMHTPADSGFGGSRRLYKSSSIDEDEPMSVGSPVTVPCNRADRGSRVRFLSESDDGELSNSLTEDVTNYLRNLSESAHSNGDEEEDVLSPEEDRKRFLQIGAGNKHRASCIAEEISLRKGGDAQKYGDSVLGKIHHDMAKYYELGRFSENEGDIDWDAALFHEQNAADLGVMEGILTYSRIHLGMERDVLVDYNVPDAEENIDIGVKYMLMAAEAGDRGAMIYMADAFATGNNLGRKKVKNYEEAVNWYDKAAHHTQADESGEFDAIMDHPTYALKAKMAELYREGDKKLEKDPSWAGDLYNEAAEEAMAAMKGRLANKYYSMAEECYGEVEED